MTAAQTWLRFNLVGVLGFVVQALVLWALVALFAVPAPIAIVFAVLAAVSHNFAWHERFTWPGSARAGRLRRWLGFNATTGMVSVVANLALTGLISRATGLQVVVANSAAVALLSLVTFFVSDRVIFSGSRVWPPHGPVMSPDTDQTPGKRPPARYPAAPRAGTRNRAPTQRRP